MHGQVIAERYVKPALCSMIHGRKLTERSLLMAGVGTEEKVPHALKKSLPHHLLESNLLYPAKGKQ